MSVEKFDFTAKAAQNWVKTALKSGVLTISFVKKDGSGRKMACTLAEDLIPSEKLPKGSGKTENPAVLAVFDTEKSEWRSFRWDSVTEISITLE